MNDWRHTRTARLLLDQPVETDLDDLHAIHADPETWRHYPGGRHTSREQSAGMVTQSARQFDRDGLGYWSVRETSDGPVVGRGGCCVPTRLPWWNLYYRFATAVHGRGYAAELGRAAVDAAHELAPDRPVIAFLLEHNVASRRTAERVGLREVWRGPDVGNPDPTAVRLVFCDRAPESSTRDALERWLLDSR